MDLALQIWMRQDLSEYSYGVLYCEFR